MKRVLKILSLSLMLITGLFLYACGAVTVTPFISLENAYIELRIGEEENVTKSVNITLSDYGSGSAQLNFSTDSAGLISFSSEYIGGGKTKLTVTGVEPGTAIINIRSLQGGATKAITVKVVQPIENLSLKNDYVGKLYGIKGSTLNLNTVDFYNFVPSKTNEKDLIFEIKTLNSGCTLNNGILTIGENTNLDKITITAKSKSKSNLMIDFEIKILKPISVKFEAGYIDKTLNEVTSTSNNYLKIYPSDVDKSMARAILTITAGTQNETLAIKQVFNSSNNQFLVSQTNYEYNNGKHIYSFTIQSNSFDAGKIDNLVFEIFYENYTIGSNNYNIKTNKLNINSYNSPAAIKVNNQTGVADVEVFENSSSLTNGRLIEFTVLPGFLESGADAIRIWAEDITKAPISLYRLNATRTAYNLVFGYDNTTGKIFCSNPKYEENNEIPYYETTSGAKLYTFVNGKYNSTSNKTAILYAQSSLYYNNGTLTGSDKALTKINFVINPNAQNIYLADSSEDKFTINYGSTINIRLGETITQYIAVDPATFIIGSSSTVKLQNNNLAILSDLTTVSNDSNYVYGKFTIQATKLGSTILTITLSDGKTKTITLNVVSPLEEIDINIENLTDNIESDIVAFTDITHTKIVVGVDNEVTLNKISIANSGSSIQFLKNATPSSAQYYLTYSYYDYTFASGVTIENAAIPKSILESIQFVQNSSILNTTSMNNFSIIEPLSSKIEGNVLLRIEVHGMQDDNSYGNAPVGVIYYLINFFVPVSSLNVTNGTLDLYPYESIGDLFIGENGQNLSMGVFNVSVNSNNGSVNPTYINTLQIYVNGSIYSIPFTNNFCYLDKDGIITFSSSNAALKIVRTLTGNIYTFTVQAYKKVTTNFVFTLVVTEINNRKITGVARVFVKDVVEISDIELVNIDANTGIYFENQNNTKTNMGLEVVSNLYSADGRDITDNQLVFDFQWDVAYENGVQITDKSSITGVISNNNLIDIEINDSGNYVITIDKSFSGKGKFKIYPRSNYFNSTNGWNGENPNAYYEIDILIADGTNEATAINIGNESDFIELLKESDKHYNLTNNLNLNNTNLNNTGISNFAGILEGNDYTISTNFPIFQNISSKGIVKNLNIIALPTSPVACKYKLYEISDTTYVASGFLACLNEGQIIDVNIEGDTHFNSAHLITNPESVTSGNEILTIGLLVGVNTGTIKYNNSSEAINVYGVNDGINEAGSTYAGGIVGFNTGTIDGAHVAVTVVGTNVGNFAGNESEENHGTITNCVFGAVDIKSFDTILNPRNKDSIKDNDLSPSELITNDNDNTAILFYYQVLGSALNDDERSDLKKKNTFSFEDLFSLNGSLGEGAPVNLDFSLFNIITNDKNILNVVGSTLEINSVGKVDLTITPKYSSAETIPSYTITIYIIYPINSYEIYEGISVANSKNKITTNETIRIKKNGTHYFTSSLKNTISLGNNVLYTIAQNKMATELFVKKENIIQVAESSFTLNEVVYTINDVKTKLTATVGENTIEIDIIDNKFEINNIIYIFNNEFSLIKYYTLSSTFNISGNLINYDDTELDDNIVYRDIGTISITTSENSGYYLLYSNLVLQNLNQTLGNLVDTDINIINNILKEVFSKEIKLEVYVGADKIQSSIIGAEIDPSNVLTIDVSLTTDNSEDGLIVEIKDENGDLVWKEQNKGNIFEVRKVTKSSFLNGKINFNAFVYIQDIYRSKITTIEKYVVYIYDSSKDIFITVNITVKPQEIISVTYSHHNRDDKSSSDNFIVKDEPSSALSPGDSGLLKINLYPTYSTYRKIVIESELINGNYVALEQMYKSGDIYLTANGTNGYSNLRDNNKLTINHTDALADDNGMVYIRTKILRTVSEGLYFPLTVKIYGLDENGNEKVVKSEQIVLVSQIVDGASITINGEKDAVVARGHDSEIKVSVPIYQDLSEMSIIDKNQSSDANDIISIYFNRAEYEIVGNRKVYTGRLRVGLNAELTGDGVFKVQTIVTRIINGRLETAIDSIKVTVVDFLVEGIYIKGNNEEDNVFDTPLGIEKELEFEFVLSPKPNAYDANQQIAVARIEAAKDYFKQNMAYKYANATDYSYVINTNRVFIKETISDPKSDPLSHVVSNQAPNSIAYNLYYTNNLTPYINQGNVQTNQYASIAYNSDGDTSDFASNLLKVTGNRVGAVSFTIRMGYQLPGSTEISYINYTFFINVQIYSDEDKPIPIDDEQKFIEYLTDEREESRNNNYILMDDITLTNFIPFTTTYFKSLDGNNKIITIKNFNINSLKTSNALNLALFRTIAADVTVKNLTVDLYQLEDIIIDEEQFQNINIAGLAIDNNGIVYNCEVITLDKDNIGGQRNDPGIRVYFSSLNKEKSKKDTTSVNISGLVINNNNDGCITNSRVGGYEFYKITGNSASSSSQKFLHKNINIIGQGNIAGFVLANKGVISASYFANGNITNKSVSGTEAVTSGFVLTNNMNGSINGSYSQGIRLGSDTNIYVTGGGVTAQGIAAGFIYQNEGHITDCYSNIKLAGSNTGRIVSGFVYSNKNNGLIERCYSASTIVGELTTQMPFTGNNARGENLQEVQNGLVNCYYVVKLYSSDSVLEEKYSTGATALVNTTLSEEKLYGFSFVSSKENQDGSWYWNGLYAELIESNSIAISARYVINNYSETGENTETANVYPYIKGYEYGSSRNPIIIRTADEFNRVFGQDVNLRKDAYYAISQMYDKTRGIIFGSYRLVSHIDFNELKTIENIKISSSIMNLTKKGEYRGVFDGNGLTISNVEITLNSQIIVGLISKLSNSAVLKNVNLTVIKIVSGNGVYVGGAVGHVENSFVSNVSVSPVKAESGDDKSQISGYNIVGGVVGYVVGSSRLSNLSSSISVTSLFKTSINEYSREAKSINHHKGLSYVGGVAGVIDIYNNILDTAVYSSKIDVNKLKYFGKNVVVQGKFVGGVAGYVGVSTYFVDALFEITGNPDDEFNQKLISYGGTDNSIGGIVGVNYGKLFEIRIEHESETQELIEYNLDNYYNSASDVFRGITTLFNTLGNDLKYIGGLVGKMMKGELTTSYAKVDVVNLTADYAGGLIGYNQAETTFYELFAFGDVDAKIVGGLIGINSGKISLSLCVAMNYYNKNNSHIKTKEDFIQWVNSLSNASLKEIDDKPSSNPEEIELKFKDSTDKIISKKYTINNSYNNQRYISVIHETLGDELYRYYYKDKNGVDQKIISDGLNYWLWNLGTTKWDILEKQNYGKFGFDYRYILEDNVVFYSVENIVYIYVDPVITQSGYTFTLPTTLEERITFSTDSSYTKQIAIINITEYYRNATYTNATNGTIDAQVYKGEDPLNNNSEIYVYIDKNEYKLVDITGESGWTLSDPSDSPITSMFYSHRTYQTSERVWTPGFWIWEWGKWTTYYYTHNVDEIIIEKTDETYSTYYRKKTGTTIVTDSKNGEFYWNLENLGRKYQLNIYNFSNYFLEKYNSGDFITIEGNGNLSSEFNNELSPPKESTVILEKIGSVIGKNSNNSSYNFANVYATTHLILNGLRFNLSSVSDGTATYSAKSLTVNNNIASFNRNIDTITTNEMFINAGWDNKLWVKEDNRIFPRLTFGITNQILYIEKPSDLVKLYKYNSQSNTVIFGDDPGTLFNPYKYDKNDISTWHNLSEKELRGLDVIPIEGRSLLIYDITYLADLLQEIGLEDNDFYFEKFLGEMYGEIENNEYMISGIKKTLFNEIIGGSVKNLIFTTIPYTNGVIEGLDVGVIEGPVLTNNILSETSLKDLTFIDINITSSKPNIGIIAQQITNVSLISDITFKNCFINSEFNNPEVTGFANVGGIAGIMESTNDTNYSIKLENIDIKGLQINVKGKDSSYATNANVGLIFGSINCNATYVDCILLPLTKTEGGSLTIPNVIQIDVKDDGAIYSGGYVGYASDTAQSIINTTGNNRIFVKDLYILIGNGNSVKAGLLFGEAKVYSKGNGITGKTDEDLNISISGFITNKYNFAQENNTLSQKSEAIIPIIAEVGGVVGRGSGNICGINVEGVFVESNYILIDFETKGENATSPTDPISGESLTVNFGGISGNSTMDNLLLSNVNISGDIIVVNNSTDNQIVSVGGLVGFTGNAFTILDSNYKNKKVGDTSYTSEITVSEKAGTLTTVYAGGIVGYSDTNGGSVFNIGKYENPTVSNGSNFEGNLIISGEVIKLYAGGIIGTTSDAVGTNGDKVNIYDSKISGNIEVQSIGDNSELYIGGVAGYIVGDIIGNYAWGNIKLNDGLKINTLQLGGIISQLNGAKFNSNYSLTSMYNENRATTTHLVRALIGKRTNVTVGTVANNQANYYCHQINLCIDTIGINLPYNSTTNYGATIKETILQKFGETGLTSSVTIGEKLRPNSISTIDTNTSFAANNYYVLTADITTSATKDVAGHLVGDGFKITTTNITPFRYVNGYISGLNTYVSKTTNNPETNKDFNGDGKADTGALGNCAGFAWQNKGIIFACNSLFMATTSPTTLEYGEKNRLGTDGAGFTVENFGMISDCGVVIYASLIASGFCRNNEGIIQNSYVTGSLTIGANATFNSNDGTNHENGNTHDYNYSNSYIVNCYTALKSHAEKGIASYTVPSGHLINSYYTAAEKTLSGTLGITDEMSTYTTSSTRILTDTAWGLVGLAPVNEKTSTWTQNYAYNFGYPTLSASAYANFSGYMRNFFYTGNGSTTPIQIISAGKITQINNNSTTLERSYVLLQNFDLSLSGYVNSWTPISNFKGTFDGNGYTISNIPSISVQNNAGFFSVNNGTIKKCNFSYASNATVNATLEENSANSIWVRAGGVVAINNGTIQTVSSSNATIDAASHIGGICAYNEGNITSASNSNSIEINNLESHIGGIVGYMESGTVKTSYNYKGLSGNKYVGGIVGTLHSGEINSCTNLKEINADERAGGIVGNMEGGTISNCTNTGKVTASVENGKEGIVPYAGGIAGYSKGTISGCTNSGTIRAYGYNDANQEVPYPASIYARTANNSEEWVQFDQIYIYKMADVYAGRIVGYNGGIIESNTANGKAYKYFYQRRYGIKNDGKIYINSDDCPCDNGIAFESRWTDEWKLKPSVTVHNGTYDDVYYKENGFGQNSHVLKRTIFELLSFTKFEEILT